MTEKPEEEWNDMKTQWKSTSVAEVMATEKLRWSLRVRMVGSWLFLGLEIAGCLLLLVLAGAAARYASTIPGTPNTESLRNTSGSRKSSSILR